MAEERVSSDVFYLDTKGFDDVAKASRKLAEKMENLKNELDSMKCDLMFSWAGEGRNTFEKKYRVLSQQFGDIGEELREISETIYEKEQEYIQADTDLAKNLEGVTNRY